MVTGAVPPSVAAMSCKKEDASVAIHQEGSLQGWKEGPECIRASLPNPRRKQHFLIHNG